METDGVVTATNKKNINGQIVALFFIEASSAVVFGVFFSGLSLYLTQNELYSKEFAAVITGLFLSMSYFLQLIGGIIANRIITYKKMFCLGLLVSFIGCLLLAYGINIKIGLALFLIRSLVSNVCLRMFITKLFDNNQISERRIAFTWNYIGMNLGFLIGGFLSGYFTIVNNYFNLYIIMASLIILSLILTLIFIKSDESEFVRSRSSMSQVGFTSLIIFSLVICMVFLFNYAALIENYITLISLVILGGVIYSGFRKSGSTEKIKYIQFSIYSGLAICFWTIYMLTPTAFMQVIENDVEQKILGITMAPQWFVNIDSIVILTFAPLFAYLIKVKDRNNIKKEQFGALRYFNQAFLYSGIAFLFLLLGLYVLDSHSKLPVWSMLGYLILLTIGEIFIAPIGNSLVGELIPEKRKALMTGAWSVNIGIGSLLSTLIANKFILPYVNKNGLNGTNLIQFQAITIFVSLVLIILSVMLFLGRKNSKTIRDIFVLPIYGS